MYYRARMMNTNLGRFGSIDTIKYEGSKWNLYTYVSERPTKFVNPFGHKPGDPVNKSGFFGSNKCDEQYGTYCNIYVKSGYKGTFEGVPWLGHQWFEWTDSSGNFQSAGFYSADESAVGPGTVHMPDEHSTHYQDAIWHVQLQIKQSGKIEAGTYKGQSCKCSTCFHIVDCINAMIKAYTGSTYSLIGSNCNDFVFRIMQACCLCANESDMLVGEKNVEGIGNPNPDNKPPSSGPAAPGGPVDWIWK